MGANEIVQKILSWTNQIVPDESNSALLNPSIFSRPKNVLLIPSQYIGDNILLTPFIRNLRQNLEANAQLDIVTTSAIASLYETLPNINHVFLEKTGALKNPRAFLETQGYDTVILCRYSLIWATAALQAKVPQRVGFDLERLGIHGFKQWGKRLTHTIPSTSVSDPHSQAEIYLDILRQLGLKVNDRHLECHLHPTDCQKAQELLKPITQASPKILIHAASASPGKSWPLLNWEQLMIGIQQKYSPVFISMGNQKERILYKPWEKKFPLLNLCGQTNLRESIALMNHVDLVITVDTAAAHMAAVSRVPRIIVLYGPTNQSKWRPWIQPGTFLAQVYQDLSCRPCITRTCEHRNCIQQLTVEQVLNAVYQSFQEKTFYH